MQEELQRWKAQREDINRYREEEDRRSISRSSSRHAAGRTERSNSDYTFSHPAPSSQTTYTPQAPLPSDPQWHQEEYSRQQQHQQQQELTRHQQQQEEFRRREEEIVKKREQKRREEQHGIVQRQQEAEQEARAVRQTIAANNSGIPAAPPTASTSSITYPTSTPASSSASTSSSSFYQIPTPTQASYTDLRAPQAVRSRPPSLSFMGSDDLPVPSVTPLPLESPARYEGDSTDSESLNSHASDWRRKQKHSIDQQKTPTRAPGRR